MYSIETVELSLVSRILLSRLSRPSTVDIGIIIPDLFFPSARDLDRLFNRYTGSFAVDSDDLPCFYLAAKSNPEGDIDHLFVYYINRDHKTLQDNDREYLKKYLSKVSDPNSGLKIGVINIICSTPQVTYLSTLLEGVNFTIGSELLSNFRAYQNIRLNVSKLAVGPLENCNLEHCDGRPHREVIIFFEKAVTETGRRFCLADARTTNLKDPDVVWIRDNGHLIVSFYCKESHVVNYLVTHRNQFLNEETYERVKSMTRRWYSNGSDLTFVVTRLYTNTFRRCDDLILRTAWRIIMYLQPHVLLTIQENELHYIDGNFEEMREWIAREKRRRNCEPALSQSQMMRIAPGIQVECDSPVDEHSVELVMSSQSRFHERLHTDEFYVYDYEELWTNDLATWEEISRRRRRIKDSIVPPIHQMEPYSDLVQLYLKTMPCYQNGIKLMEQIWNRYAPTVAFGKLQVESNRECDITGAHFVIAPLESHHGEDCLLIIDQIKRSWIYLNPNNEAHRSSEIFVDVKRQVLSIFPETSGYESRPVLMTSSFQVAYPRLHLLMSLYVISRLFHYCKLLPEKIIYGDWELRKYAHDICAELQFVNALYNKMNNLVDGNGWLLEGAYQSLPSPLVIENFVVPKDQCMICKRRYKKNLGRHMASVHGEQAALASHARLEFD